MNEFLHTIAIAMVLTVYLWSGLLFKPRNFKHVRQELTGKGVPFASALLVGAILLETVGAVALLLPKSWMENDVRFPIIGMYIFYTGLAAILFHAFWSSAPEERIGQTVNFLKNVGLIGAFILIGQSYQ